LIDDLYEIHSYEHIIYITTHHCNIRHNTYLLFQTRPKNITRNFTIRIDIFNKNDLVYYTSWYLTIPFQFLPINRLNTRVTIPAQPAQMLLNCSLECNHGRCMKYANTEDTFCYCNERWSGSHCNIPFLCNCAFNSVCIGSIGNRSICVCPIGRFGPRCLLQNPVCQSNTCKNGGQCIPVDERILENQFTCLCSEGFSGSTCKIVNTKIFITFKRIIIPQSILLHLIQIFPIAHPTRTTIFKKIPFDSDTTIVFTSNPFHIIFIEFAETYYLVLTQKTYSPLAHIRTDVVASQQCASIDELFNTTVLNLNPLRRLKFYHVPCEERFNLSCFYDEKWMCLCDVDHHGNCFESDHNMHYNCLGQNYCEHNGQCFQDDPICPTTSLCVCGDCFFGRRCQFSTQGFDLSLDAIIGYSIHSNVTFLRQPMPLKISVILTTIIYIIGLVNGILSTITFQAKNLRKTGCGLYLLSASITSLFTMNVSTLKLIFLILIQMALVINPFFLRLNCTLIDFHLKFLLNSGDWLYACVAIERAATVCLGLQFNQMKSKRMAKWIILCVFLLCSLIAIHDPIHRHLINDDDEKRIWCIVTYSVHLKKYTSMMNLFHFFLPFIINIVCALMIIIIVARKRSIVHENQNYKKQIRQQLQHYKHLLITPCILVLLAMPRLIISFVSGCMKSTRDPWLFLVAYFISLLPHIFALFLFILSSKIYFKQCQIQLKSFRLKICRC
jgi:hypothetical protein